jgi:D-glycero-D-manno-heptose 1,7-bisphosphate phosphatase
LYIDNIQIGYYNEKMNLPWRLKVIIIFDKDGTLIEPASGSRFVQSPSDQQLLPGVEERVAQLVAMGATLVIASNQGGVAAGHKSLADAIAEMRFCLELLPAAAAGFFCHNYEGNNFYAVGAGIQGNHSLLSIGDYLASEPGGEDFLIEDLLPLKDKGFFRKPNPGMLLFAMKDCGDREAIMIGDRPEDAQAATSAGIPFIDAASWRTGKVTIAPSAFIA